MKLNNITTKSIALSLALLAGTVAQLAAQDMTSYFMPNSVSRRSLNVAFTPEQGYLSIPLIGNTMFSTSGNLAIGDLLYPVDGNLALIFDTSVSTSAALSSINRGINTFGIENRLSILNFGSYSHSGKTFWDFSLNLRSTTNFSAPYELFEFVKTGDNVDIKNVSFNIESYVEAAIGITKPINDKLTVGARLKFLTGLVDAKFQIDDMNVTLTDSEWAANASGYLDLNMAGAKTNSTLNDQGQEVFQLGDIDTSLSSPSGFGAAIDLGATYLMLDDKLELSIAANDIGFISWGAGNNTSATIANNFTFTGVDVDVDENETVNNTNIQLDDIELVKQASKSSTKWLQANINIGAQYLLLEKTLGVGMVYSNRFWRTESVSNLTASASYTPISWFTFATSYAFTNNDANALGFAANFSTSFINFYISSDILTSRKSAQFIPIDQSMMNIAFGIALPIGHKRSEF